MSSSYRIFLADEAATVAFGAQLAACFHAGLIVYFQGTLGAGKTTLCRSFLRALGHSGAVKSPTYTLVEPYGLSHNGKELTVYHFDLYRLSDPEELEFMGIRDYFAENSVCLIEWPERGAGYLPEADLLVELYPHDKGRQLIVSAASAKGGTLVDAIHDFDIDNK